jgi:enoyl-CoA hydratase/carnithine racemase
MGACAMLPRVIGQGRAAELLFTGRTMTAEEGERWGFFNRLAAADQLEPEAIALAKTLAEGPTFGHMMTKTMLAQEWSMSLEQAIEAEAQAQAICMQTQDFVRLRSLVAKQTPRFSETDHVIRAFWLGHFRNAPSRAGGNSIQGEG